MTAFMPISSSGEDDEEYGAVLSLGRLRFRLGGGFTFWSFTGDRFVAEVVGCPGSGVKDGVLIVTGRPSIRSTSLLHPCRSRSGTVAAPEGRLLWGVCLWEGVGFVLHGCGRFCIPGCGNNCGIPLRACRRTRRCMLFVGLPCFQAGPSGSGGLLRSFF